VQDENCADRISLLGLYYVRHVMVQLDFLHTAAEDAMESSHCVAHEMAFEILYMSLSDVWDAPFSLIWVQNESAIRWGKLLVDLECNVVMMDDMLILMWVAMTVVMWAELSVAMSAEMSAGLKVVQLVATWAEMSAGLKVAMLAVMPAGQKVVTLVVMWAELSVAMSAEMSAGLKVALMVVMMVVMSAAMTVAT
jgi:hypothetical protein